MSPGENEEEIINPVSEKLTSQEWAEINIWASVSSSNVESIRYDLEKKQLWVRFLNGGMYRYLGVPTSIAMALFDAQSKGKFLASVIKRGFAYQKMYFEES